MPASRASRAKKEAPATSPSPVASDVSDAEMSDTRPDPNALWKISGIQANFLLDDGVQLQAAGSGKVLYTLKRTADHYYCTCPAWRNAGGAPNARTCKHLRLLLGEKYEDARIQQADPGVGTTFHTSPVAGTKRKAKAAADEDDDEELDSDGEPVKPIIASRKKSTRKTTPPKALKDASFKPLLAHKWDLESGADPTGWHMSEKLDGVRAVWHGDKGTFLSRQGNPFYAPDWFVKNLPRDQTLDGELFTTRGGFQKCVSIVRTQNNPDAWKFAVSYQVFDVPSMGDRPFEERMAWLKKKFSGRKWIKVVEHEECKSREHLFEKLKDVTKLKGEGLMLREPGSVYEEGRSRSLLKVKEFFDADAIVRAHVTGSGKNSNCTGALRVEMLDDAGEPTGKIFKVGTGFTDAQRRSPPKIGSTIIYRYQELSNSGTPRFPSYVGERAD